MVVWEVEEEMSKGPYLKFDEVLTRDPKRITKVWSVISVEGGSPLGHVSWFAAWWRYCFWPNDKTLYDAACLSEIAEFCSARTAEAKENQVERRAHND